MTARDAVSRFVRPGAIVGLGGQNINRCPMALVHEIIRHGAHNLTVVGCNLSLPLDMLAAAALVTHTEQGSGNLERYGSLFTWRRLVESGMIEAKDYSHLGMASRFLGGALGVPSMPIRSLLGTDMLERLVANEDAQITEDPWTGQRVVLLPSLAPDVSIIHASRADEDGNVAIDGVTSHEIDMVRASASTIVTVEEVVSRTALSSHAEAVSISCAFVDAVVHQPFGAFPTSVYKRYDYCEEEIRDYQARSRSSPESAREYLAEVHEVSTFDDFLQRRDPAGQRRRALEDAMRSLM